MKSVRALMVQGTTSDAGKTTLVAALCRVFYRQQRRVVPFKPQNMALNSAVTFDGGEIGRAQALQALACHVPAHTDMNPVLIKPTTDVGAQIIVHGKAIKNMQAQDFHRYKPEAKKAVLQSYERLKEEYEWILVEGAGSPAEINLREGDIANMGFAEAIDCPVIIVADIDRGGVFAHLLGTLALLSESEQNRVVGFVINRFRGDIALLQNGLDWLEEKTNKPVLAVLPYIHNLALDAEDAIGDFSSASTNDALKIVVPVLPRISNHTDFDALRMHPRVELSFVNIDDPLPPCDLIILPGSKNVIKDLSRLKECGWSEKINKHLRYNGKLAGICGGYQMLGQWIHDPYAVESSVERAEGFGLIPTTTVLHREKILKHTHGHMSLVSGDNPVEFSGYEIHCGVTEMSGDDLRQSVEAFSSPLRFSASSVQDDGDVIANTQGLEKHNLQESFLSDDGQIFGCYIHGIFDSASSCDHFLKWAGLTADAIEGQAFDLNQHRERELNRLADQIEESMDLSQLDRLIENFYQRSEQSRDD